eukprot:3929982-Prymnesium_polylepis.1
MARVRGRVCVTGLRGGGREQGTPHACVCYGSTGSGTRTGHVCVSRLDATPRCNNLGLPKKKPVGAVPAERLQSCVGAGLP